MSGCLSCVEEIRISCREDVVPGNMAQVGGQLFSELGDVRTSPPNEWTLAVGALNPEVSNGTSAVGRLPRSISGRLLGSSCRTAARLHGSSRNCAAGFSVRRWLESRGWIRCRAMRRPTTHYGCACIPISKPIQPYKSKCKTG